MGSPYSKPTIEQLLYDLPPIIDDFNGRSFLHLQPWADRAGWNAFYGSIGHYGWAVHPVYSFDAPNAIDALMGLQGLIESMEKFTLEPDPNGFNEQAKSRKIGGESSA